MCTVNFSNHTPTAAITIRVKGPFSQTASPLWQHLQWTYKQLQLVSITRLVTRPH